MRPRRVHLLVAGATLVGSAGVVHADDTPSQTVQVTASHYQNGVGTSDAASQGVVSGDLLADIPLLRPGEALETVPGLVVTQHSGDGKANQYFLRGYNLDHGTDLATSVDGLPVNMPTNAHGQGYSDLNFLIPELVDHIDYRKGAYFAENGDFSAAGSADIHYRNSLAHDLLEATAGNNDYQRLLLAGSRQLLESGPSLLGAVELEHTNGPWTTPEGLHKANMLLRLSDSHGTSNWSLDAIHYDAAWTSTDQVPLPLIQSGALGRFSALDPTDGGDTVRDALVGQWRTADAGGFLGAKAYAEHYKLRLFSDFTFYELRDGQAPNANLPSDQFEQTEARNLVGGELVKGWNLAWPGRDSLLEAGLQVRRDHIDVGLLDTQSRVAFATVTNNHVTETSSGVFVKDTTSWSPTVRSVLGVRADRVQMDMTAYVLPQNSGRAAQGMLSPKGSLIFGPWNHTEFFVSAGRGFHSNDARGVIDKVDPTSGDPSSPVPALVAAVGKEIGMRTEAIPGLQSSLALWSLNSDSELVYNADSDIGSTSPNAASRRYGVEWNNHYVANTHWLLDADLAWTRARFTKMNQNGDVGDHIPNAIPVVARFGATWHSGDGWLGVLEARYFGAYPISQDGTMTAPAAFVNNWRLQKALAPGVTLGLDVLNVFDRKYFDIAYEQDYEVSPTAPVVPNGETVHPGEPREFRVTLSIRL